MIKPELLKTINEKINLVVNGVIRENLISEILTHEELKDAIAKEFTSEELKELAIDFIFTIIDSKKGN